MTIAGTGTTRHRDGWRGCDLDVASLTCDLTPDHLAAMDNLLAGIRADGLAFHEIERRHFDHPALSSFFAEFLRALKYGPGILILRGLPVDSYGIEDLERLYWGIGTHLGRGCSQSSAGDMLGHVTDRQTARGYTSNRELKLHCDSAEIAALLCVRPAREGGKTILASSLKLHEILEREHPDYLAVVERGFPYHRRGEQAPGQEPITPYDVPVFSMAEGILSCRYSRGDFELALRDLGRKLTPLEEAAVTYVDERAMADDMRLELTLNPGEALFMNNFEVLHARTAFTDWDEPARKRLLFRLWLQGEPTRPLHPHALSFLNEGGRHGIDRQEGQVPGQPQFTVPSHLTE